MVARCQHVIQNTRQTIERVVNCLPPAEYTKNVTGNTFTNAALLSVLSAGRTHSHEGVCVASDEATQQIVVQTGRDGSMTLDGDGTRLIESFIAGFSAADDLNKSRVGTKEEIKEHLSGVSCLLLSQHTFANVMRGLSNGPLVRAHAVRDGVCTDGCGR